MCVCVCVCIYIIEVWEGEIKKAFDFLFDISWRQNAFLNSSHKKELKSERVCDFFATSEKMSKHLLTK